MPELPEVETTRRGLNQRARDVIIQSVMLGKPLRWALGCSPESLVGLRLESRSRRGKYLIAQLSEGHLLIHLGMSGSLLFSPQSPPAGPHDHVRILTNGGELRLNDPRRFGAVVYVASLDAPQATQRLQHLGLEPLTSDFTLAAFAQGLKPRKSAIKQVLLTGHVVVGVGNIYASEVLFLAGIHPLTPANQLSFNAVARLHQAIPQVLQQALEEGGTTLRNYSDAQGHRGSFQNHARVYGKEGQVCQQCHQSPITRMFQQQRSTFFCPICQPSAFVV